jgi:hypothetical protein
MPRQKSDLGFNVGIPVYPDGRRLSAGGAQYGLAVSTSVVTLTVPASAEAGEVYVRTAAVVFTRDGTDPTSTKGIQANVGDIILLNSRDELEDFEVIRKSSNATLDVEYFTDLPV